MRPLAIALALLAGPALADGPSTAPSCPSVEEFLDAMTTQDPGITRATTDRLWAENLKFCMDRGEPLSTLMGFTDRELLERVFNGTHVSPPRPSPVPLPPAFPMLAMALAWAWAIRLGMVWFPRSRNLTA